MTDFSTTTLTPQTIVRDIAAELPGAAELFRKNGISFCCGGKLPLAEAAAKAGVKTEDLLTDLRAIAEATTRDAPEETLPLIEHILARYHVTHRNELAWLIPLAERVEMVHGDHEAAPIGLAKILKELSDDLENHMAKEEQVLFPMIRQGGAPMISMPIEVMRQEHARAADMLRGIEHATSNLTLPEGACGSWTALYTGLRKFGEDLVVHIHLENDVLFPRFAPVS